jgi:hypothetical protein
MGDMATNKPKDKNQTKGKHPGGRPTNYKAEYSAQVEKLCRLGATDKEIADFFGVSEVTINAWKKAHPQFLMSIKSGKMLADANVADRLYQRAMGFEHDSEEIKVVPTGRTKPRPDNQEDEEQETTTPAAEDHPAIVRVPIKKIYPPDTGAAIFWLKNRQPKKWRDKIEQGFTNGDGEDIPPPVTVFQIPDNGRDKHNTAAGGVPDEGPQQSG